MLILQLVDKKLLRLESKISEYLNYYPKETGNRITVHHLLTHTSGIPDVTNFSDFDQKYRHQHFETRELLELFYSLPLEFEPGSDFSYSNSGYSVLAAIIEAVTNKSYPEILNEFIIRPVGMTNTGWADNKKVIEEYADGYQWAALDGYINAAYFDNSISLGAGGIYSTVNDLYKWDQALNTNKLIPDSLLQKMITPFKNNYSYGFSVIKWKNPNSNV